MAFIRKIHISGNDYYYLVENHRSGGKVVQRIIEYLGGEIKARDYAKKHNTKFPTRPLKSEMRNSGILDDDIKRLKRELDGYRPISPAIEDKLKEQLIVDWTYNSNAIEGNTLTRKETRDYFETGTTLKGKPVKDYTEATNHRNAIEHIFKSANEKRSISEEDILHIHYLILSNIDNRYAGKYRDVRVRITGSRHYPPLPNQVPKLMKKLVGYINDNWNTKDPIELAAVTHLDFESIHPFVDGNGRTGRLLANLILMKRGYPPIVIEMAKKRMYYDALERGDVYENVSAIVGIFKRYMKKALDNYLELVKPDIPQLTKKSIRKLR